MANGFGGCRYDDVWYVFIGSSERPTKLDNLGRSEDPIRSVFDCKEIVAVTTLKLYINPVFLMIVYVCRLR
jgi:hypothetical protein